MAPDHVSDPNLSPFPSTLSCSLDGFWNAPKKSQAHRASLLPSIREYQERVALTLNSRGHLGNTRDSATAPKEGDLCLLLGTDYLHRWSLQLQKVLGVQLVVWNVEGKAEAPRGGLWVGSWETAGSRGPPLSEGRPGRPWAVDWRGGAPSAGEGTS